MGHCWGGDVNLWVSHNSIPVLEVTVQLKIDFQFKQFSDQMILDHNAVCIMLLLNLKAI